MMQYRGWAASSTLTRALLHFLVDGLCVCCLFQLATTMGKGSLLPVFIVYNILAFLTQPLTGMLADRQQSLGVLLALAMALLSVGVALATLSAVQLWTGFPTAFAVAAFLGFGNSLFHVWGGKAVAVNTGNDARSLGLFVSTGIMGLAVGVVFHDWLLLYVLLGALTILVASELWRGEPRRDDSLRLAAMSPATTWTVVLLMMAFVLSRSFVGENFTGRLSDDGVTVLAIAAVAMLGKMGGGWLAHWIGAARTLALLVAGVVFCLWAGASPPVLLLGLLMVNGTMAVTLCWTNAALHGSEGLAFGLLAAALMPGYLLAHGNGVDLFFLLLMVIPTIVIELGVLWLLRERRTMVLWSSVVVNVLTNVPLNLLLNYVGVFWTTIAIGELAVLLAETLWYRYYVERWRMAFAYSFLCNAISFLTGLLVQLLWLLFTLILQKSV